MFELKLLIFMKNTNKLIISKPMKHRKNADTLLFLILFTKSQREQNIEKIFFVSAVARKR